MDYFQLEEALELLEQIQPLVIDLPRLRAKLLDISRDLEILQLFIVSPNGDSECEQLDLLSAFPSSQVAFEEGVKRVAWTAAVNSVHLLVTQAEWATSSRPGCLPRDEGACELMALIFELRGRVLSRLISHWSIY